MNSLELPFTQLGRYEVLAPIAEGGMATVYAGRSLDANGRPVAIKVIRAEHSRNKEFVAMFLDEARIASRLSHPNVVDIVEFGHDGATYFLAMDLILGQTLAKISDVCRARKISLPFDVVAWIGARVAEALHYAHELRDENGKVVDVVHRDINPSNILVTYDGCPKVIDFGLARAADRITSTAKGIVKGKLAYLSPEQVQGQPADRRADIFALGVTLWEITVGRRLFKAEDDVGTIQRLISADVADPASLVPGYPEPLARAIMHALVRDPDARYATAAELARDLDACALRDGVSVGAREVAAIMSSLFPDDGRRPAWEKAAKVSLKESATMATVRNDDDDAQILAWDDDAQKMTWMQVEGAPPPPLEPAPATDVASLRALLARRAGTVKDDAIAAARVAIEGAIVEEILGDASAAASRANEALALDSLSTAAHWILRRVQHTRESARGLIAHLDAEIAAGTTEMARADLLAERARLLEASGESNAEVCTAWERALATKPGHAAALKGLEAAYATNANDPGRARKLANHLGRMAEAYADAPKLAAWLHVERAEIQDATLGEVDAAWGALSGALELDSGLGPVRDACVKHASMHRDATSFVALLETEAQLEPDPARAASLELDAASMALLRLGDGDRARALLERARARGTTSPLVYRRILDDLVRIHETHERWSEAREVRRARLPLQSDVRARTYELTQAASLAERSGDRAAAIADIDEARILDPEDGALRDRLDAFLSTEPMRREALWTDVAARATDTAERGRAWSRAAQIAEENGANDRAIGHLRTALATSPDEAVLAEKLAAMLSGRSPAATLEEVRARIAVYAHAAERTGDAARKIAYLEKIALLWEEVIGDHALAASAYESILALEPSRRGAILGLQRTARRANDSAREARAIEAEAKSASDPAIADDLRVRAAELLASIDPERSLQIALDVIARDPKNDGARVIEARLHEVAGRWEKADHALAGRIEHAQDRATRVRLWLARAEIQRTRLASPADALTSLRAARGLDPSHPALAGEIVAAVEAMGDPRALRAALVETAKDATAIDRAQYFVRAAEIDELVLQDDVAAGAAYAQALEASPADAWIEDRLARVLARRGRVSPNDPDVRSMTARTERGTPRDLFARARALASAGDGAASLPLLESILASDPMNAPALRTLEAIAKKPFSAPMLANALEQQASAFEAEIPRLGALWAEASLIEWVLPETPGLEIYTRILAIAPHDRAALDALLRRASRASRTGDADARATAARALTPLLAQAADDTTRLAILLARALLLDVQGEAAITNVRSALAEYREALRIDPRSPVAAAGTARLAAIAHDHEATFAATVARAELAIDPRSRAVLLVQATGTLLSADDPKLGAREVRRAKALDLLERALAADSGSLSAAGALITLCTEDGQRDRLVHALRNALAQASTRDAIVGIGTELARVAAAAPADLALAVSSLQRVREAAPDHAPALFALASAYSAQQAWPESVFALEATVVHASDRIMKRRALFALADLYERVLKKPADVERVYRLALIQDPRDARAIRGLLPYLRTPERITKEGVPREIAALLENLAASEEVPAQKTVALLELAEARLSLGERAAAEQALVEATAQSPSPELLARIATFAGASPSDYARALGALATRATQLGRPNPAALVALAELEVGVLGRFADGVTHARTALALDARAHTARAIVARGLAHSGQAAEALATALPLIEPDAAPLLSLREPDAALAVLETSFLEEHRDQEAFVVREIRAIAAGVDDATVVSLRARRVSAPDLAGSPGLLDAATLRARVLPPEGQHVLLDVAIAIAGAETKLLPDDLEGLRPTPHDRVPSNHPLRIAFDRAARALGVESAELVVSDDVAYPTVTPRATPLVVVPRALAAQPEPVQVAAVSRALTRIALDLPWIARVPTAHVRALLTAAARIVVPDYGIALHDQALEETVARYAGPIAQAVSRKQKRVLSTLASTLASSDGPTAAEVDAFVLAEARTEFRVAFLLTADLLATLDELRAKDGAFAQATSIRGLAALAATLAHPIAGDTCRFAMTATATSLRRNLGTWWGAARS